MPPPVIVVTPGVPGVNITGPSPGANYVLGQRVSVRYSCSDPVLTITRCSGSVPNGSYVKTGSVGRYSFTVTAVDSAGRTFTSSVGYAVGYRICQASPPAQDASTITFKIYPCNVSGGDVTNRSTAITAVSTDGKESPAKSGPPRQFVLALGGRQPLAVYRLDVKDLKPGVHTLRVAVANDPITHSITFIVKRPAPPRSARR
jgi:hypothetical protein